MNIQEFLSEIDNKPFIKFVSDVVYEISSEDDAKIVYEPIKLSVRYACLLDMYYETRDTVYLKEAKKQREKLYHMIPKQNHRNLMSTEKRVRKFFDYENSLRDRIQKGNAFTEKDVKQYIRRKSWDNLFYGKILKIFVPEWDLTNELRIQTMLFDIGKDITDYEDDIKNGLPNVLYMYLCGGVEKSKIPQNVIEAIFLAKELGISKNILMLASKLKEKALMSKDLENIPILKNAIIDRYNRVRQLLKL